jgi:hypothetical protein
LPGSKRRAPRSGSDDRPRARCRAGRAGAARFDSSLARMQHRSGPWGSGRAVPPPHRYRRPPLHEEAVARRHRSSSSDAEASIMRVQAAALRFDCGSAAVRAEERGARTRNRWQSGAVAADDLETARPAQSGARAGAGRLMLRDKGAVTVRGRVVARIAGLGFFGPRMPPLDNDGWGSTQAQNA